MSAVVESFRDFEQLQNLFRIVVWVLIYVRGHDLQRADELVEVAEECAVEVEGVMHPSFSFEVAHFGDLDAEACGDLGWRAIVTQCSEDRAFNFPWKGRALFPWLLLTS